MDTRARSPFQVVVMGVSGAGKTTVGRALADRLSLAYADGDAFHSAENVAKMASGRALSDDDREPWLCALGGWLSAQRQRGAVVSCSALRRAYRDRIRSIVPDVRFLHLHADPALLQARMAARTGHFMPVSLLTSQLAALEPLQPDESGITLDASLPPAQLVAAFVDAAQGR